MRAPTMRGLATFAAGNRLITEGRADGVRALTSPQWLFLHHFTKVDDVHQRALGYANMETRPSRDQILAGLPLIEALVG